jgi:hypothetical protein
VGWEGTTAVTPRVDSPLARRAYPRNSDPPGTHGGVASLAPSPPRDDFFHLHSAPRGASRKASSDGLCGRVGLEAEPFSIAAAVAGASGDLGRSHPAAGRPAPVLRPAGGAHGRGLGWGV